MESQQATKENGMVTPVDEPQEEQDDVVVPEMEVEEVSAPSTSKKSEITFDFAVGDTDRPNLSVYTISIKPPEEESYTVTVLAPNYGTALEMAGASKATSVKVSEVPFEG